MTNHVQTVVYTIYMNKFSLVAAIFVGLVISKLPAAGYAQETQPVEENNIAANTPPASTETTPAKEGSGQRISGNAERPIYPPSQKRTMKLLANTLNQQSTQWIDSDDGPFFAIWQEDRSGDAKGALLIIHANGEHPAWPQTTKPLHDTLPDYGWATMAISLPPTKQTAPPKRTFPVKARQAVISDTEKASATETQKTQAPEPEVTSQPNDTNNIEALTDSRLTAALKFLHDKGQFNVAILGSGTGAIRANTFLKNISPNISDQQLKARLEKPIRAFMTYNARNKMSPQSQEYEDWFSDPEVPVLDIYTTTDLRNQRESQTRKIIAKQKKVSQYSQAKIAEMSYEKAWGENRLSRRIRSFLDAHVKGVEVKNAQVRK